MGLLLLKGVRRRFLIFSSPQDGSVERQVEVEREIRPRVFLLD